jgi:sepiapterin reductase
MTKVIITGASKGIGAALAKQFSKIAKSHSQYTPMQLILTARSEKQLSEVAQACSHESCSVQQVVGDITDPTTITRLVETTNSSLDVLIHNSGMIEPISAIADMSDDDLEVYNRNMNVNFMSAVRLTVKLLPIVRQSKGTVFFVSSGAATRPIDGWSAYCSSKSALLQFASCLSEEESSNGIKVVSVRPGVVDTDMQTVIRETGKDKMRDYDKFNEMKQTGTLLKPEDVAELLCPMALEPLEEWNGKLVDRGDDEVTELANKFYKR